MKYLFTTSRQRLAAIALFLSATLAAMADTGITSRELRISDFPEIFYGFSIENGATSLPEGVTLQADSTYLTPLLDLTSMKYPVIYSSGGYIYNGIKRGKGPFPRLKNVRLSVVPPSDEAYFEQPPTRLVVWESDTSDIKPWLDGTLEVITGTDTLVDNGTGKCIKCEINKSYYVFDYIYHFNPESLGNSRILTLYPDSKIISKSNFYAITADGEYISLKVSSTSASSPKLTIPGNVVAIRHEYKESVRRGKETYSYGEGPFRLEAVPIDMMSNVSLDNSLVANSRNYYDLDGDGVLEWIMLQDYKPAKIFTYCENIYSNAGYLLSEADMPYQKTGMCKWLKDVDGSIYAYLSNSGTSNYGGEESTLFKWTDNKCEKWFDLETVYNKSELCFSPIVSGTNGLSFFARTYNYRDDVKYVLRKDADGIFHKDHFNWIPWSEYQPKPYVEPVKSGFSIPSLADGWMISSPTIPGSFNGRYASIEKRDINNDGRLDVVDASSGIVFLNIGSDKYVPRTTGGSLLLRDLNADGIEDYFHFDASENKLIANISQPDGSLKETTVLTGYELEYLSCYDFNRDGRPDPVAFVLNKGSLYVVIFENKADGTFRRHENIASNIRYNIQIIDINADGKYELLFADKNFKYGYYTFDGFKLSSIPQGPFDFEFYGVLNPANDGRAIALTNKYFKEVSPEINQCPEAPKNLKAIYEKSTGLLSVFWDAATDAETPSADLDYELRIGTSPEAGDVFAVNALPDGTRRGYIAGNVGYRTRTLIDVNSWNAGTYYLSVQAIDPNNRGSKFSTPVTFVKPEGSNDFIVEARANFAVGDTATVILGFVPEVGVSSDFDFDGARIISVSDDKRTYKIVYDEPGVKNITYNHMSADGHASTSSSKELKVLDFNLTELSGDPSYDFIKYAVDLDCDGVMEAYVRHELYEETTPGEFDEIKRLYNSHEKIGDLMSAKTADLNRDGLPDLYKLDGCSLLKAINYGDKDLEIEYIEDQTAKGEAYDFNNDGLMDRWYSPYIYANKGDYLDFNAHNLPIKPGGEYSTMDGFYDINGDGLIDLYQITNSRNPLLGFDDIYKYSINWYINQGDFSFKYDGDYICEFKSPGYKDIFDIGDYDGDGKIDLWCKDDESKSETYNHQIMFWGDGTKTDFSTLEYKNQNVKEVSRYSSHFFDFDNNGLIDFIAEPVDGNHYMILFQYPGHVFKVKESSCASLYHENEVFRSKGGYILYRNHSILSTPNTAPKAPTELRYAQNEKYLVIEWNPSVDAESPATAMRYNLSVKRKGASGDGAYIISPCNAGKNGVAPATNQELLSSTMFTMPLSAIPASKYEVMVQGIDPYNEPSDFSAVMECEVRPSAFINLPTSAGLGVETHASLPTGSTRAATSIDWDGGKAVGDDVRGYTVVWNTPGMKSVTVNGNVQNIYVHPAPVSAFTLPTSVLRDAAVKLECENMNVGTWTVPESVVFDRVKGTMTFSENGKYTLTHIVTDRFGVKTESTAIVDVFDAELPSFAGIGANDEYRYELSISEVAVPQGATGIVVYRNDGNDAGARKIATIAPDARSYTDVKSDARTTAATYSLAWEFAYGESKAGETCSPLHLVLTAVEGAHFNAWWRDYINATAPVESYRVLRGTTPTELSAIGTVDTTTLSWLDPEARTAECFYAVESKVGDRYYRSNVVSTADAMDAKLISTISIIGADNGEQIEGEVQLAAIVTPLDATLKCVNWTVAEGKDIAEISQTGLLRIKSGKSGSVTVRATAVDGSGAYAELQIGGVSGIDAVDSGTSRVLRAYPTIFENTLTVEGVDNGEVLFIVNMQGVVVKTVKVTDDAITIDGSNLASGHYIIVSDRSRRSARVIRR